MYRLLRPLLFQLDAEQAHGLGMGAVKLGGIAPGAVRALYGWRDDRLSQTLWGLRFHAPLGLAAGFDKNAAGPGLWPALGFGFAEVGSVTARASSGNPRPRAFRLPEDRALINRMGLNNDGAEAVADRLARADRPSEFVLAVNVAKTHDPDILGDAGIEDFQTSVRHLLPHADLLVLNVSCPNTAEGKTFEDPAALDALLTAVMDERARQSSRVPVLVKLSPPASAGLDTGAVDESVAVCLRHGVEGFVATNTASDRDGLATPAKRLAEIGNGGLSGAPLAARADALVRHLYRRTDGAVPLIGVGGIDSPEAAYRRIRLGASLLEVYTGLVYEGPGLVRRIHKGLVRLLDRDGLGSLTEAVGLDA
ncbi:MAG: quinone-dependent dihydroorotate dehydrogenase [Bacteroidota bacterium]